MTAPISGNPVGEKKTGEDTSQSLLRAELDTDSDSSIIIPTSSLIAMLHHFKAFLVPSQRRNFGFHGSHTFRKPTHDAILIRIDEICRSLGAGCVCLCFALRPTTLRFKSVLES